MEDELKSHQKQNEVFVFVRKIGKKNVHTKWKLTQSWEQITRLFESRRSVHCDVWQTAVLKNRTIQRGKMAAFRDKTGADVPISETGQLRMHLKSGASAGAGERSSPSSPTLKDLTVSERLPPTLCVCGRVILSAVIWWFFFLWRMKLAGWVVEQFQTVCNQTI